MKSSDSSDVVEHILEIISNKLPTPLATNRVTNTIGNVPMYS